VLGGCAFTLLVLMQVAWMRWDPTSAHTPWANSRTPPFEQDHLDDRATTPPTQPSDTVEITHAPSARALAQQGRVQLITRAAEDAQALGLLDRKTSRMRRGRRATSSPDRESHTAQHTERSAEEKREHSGAQNIEQESAKENEENEERKRKGAVDEERRKKSKPRRRSISRRPQRLEASARAHAGGGVGAGAGSGVAQASDDSGYVPLTPLFSAESDARIESFLRSFTDEDVKSRDYFSGGNSTCVVYVCVWVCFHRELFVWLSVTFVESLSLFSAVYSSLFSVSLSLAHSNTDPMCSVYTFTLTRHVSLCDGLCLFQWSIDLLLTVWMVCHRCVFTQAHVQLY
jgi:hypothetical protein